MGGRIAHLCYAGLSGATTAALNIAGGSTDPTRHSFVLLGRCEVHSDHAATLDSLGCSWRAVRKRTRWDIACYHRSAGALAGMEPEAVIAHGVRALPTLWCFARRRRAVRRIVMVHTAPERLNTWVWRRLAGHALELSHKAVAVSQSQKQWLATTPPMSRFAGKLCHIPNGLDVEFWRQEPGLSMRGGPTRLTMVASLVKGKGQATLLDAMAILSQDARDVQLTLVGDGPGLGELESLAQRLSLSGRVTFAGSMGRQGVRDVLGRTDLYVHASPAESFGMAMAEAMLAGVPVVASASAGTAELLDDGALGWLARHDARSLSAAVGEAMDAPAEAERRAIDAQRKAMRLFDRREVSRAVEALADGLSS